VPRTNFDDAGVESVIRDLPVIGIGKSFKRRNNDRARNVATVFLADYIVELAICDQVHSPISARVGNGSPNECNRTTPRFGSFGKVEAVGEHNSTRIPGTSSVPATCIGARRSCGLASLNVAIKASTKQVGAVRCIPYEVVVRNGVSVGAHGLAILLGLDNHGTLLKVRRTGVR
jgi:hypothetical protein